MEESNKSEFYSHDAGSDRPEITAHVKHNDSGVLNINTTGKVGASSIPSNKEVA